MSEDLDWLNTQIQFMEDCVAGGVRVDECKDILVTLYDRRTRLILGMRKNNGMQLSRHRKRRTSEVQ
jgi:hypothetical protein